MNSPVIENHQKMDTYLTRRCSLGGRGFCSRVSLSSARPTRLLRRLGDSLFFSESSSVSSELLGLELSLATDIVDFFCPINQYV